jgi:amidase
MKFPLPTSEEIVEIARSLHMRFDRATADEFREMMAGIFASYEDVDAAPEHLPPVRFPRTPGSAPEPEANPHGAWIRRTDIVGAPAGPLAGRTLAVKDSFMVAGVPMSGGTRFFSGFVPEVDATVVARLLDAGATIVGKTVCEYLGISGSSHTGFPGPVHNPWRRNYGAGGSSSGSAVVVATGAADMALGTDQGGSIRIPAAWSGIVGMKPTYGLVPYTGIMPIEVTLDHAGPMTRTVRDNALMLSVMAGHDPLDHRQYPEIAADDYLGAIGAGIKGLRVGVLRQGFGWPVSEAIVDDTVRDAAHRLAGAGAIVEEVDLPVHRDARGFWTPLFIEGFLDLAMNGNGAGTNHRGLFVGAASDAFSRWRDAADEMSASTKVVLLAAAHFARGQAGRFYGKSQNLMRQVALAYDAVLRRHDVLIMPTTPMRAQPLPPAGAGNREIWDAALGMNLNTAPFCSTGHPAISVPCGLAEGLPVGMMLVGRHFDEATLYRAAQVCEDIFGCLPARWAEQQSNMTGEDWK